MRRKNALGVLIGLSCLVVGQSVCGQGIILTDFQCDPTIVPDSYIVENLGGGHYNVFLINNNPGNWFEIHPTIPGLVIENVVVQVPPSVAMIRILEECDDPATKIQDIWNIVGASSHAHLLGLVDIFGDLGSVNIHSIGNLLIGGDITGNIISTQTSVPTNGIATVDASGSIFGDIRAPFGRIGFIRADGDIGTAVAPVAIEAHEYIRNITQAQNLYADINARVNGGTTGTISKIIVDTFVGSLEARTMANQPSGGELHFNVQLAATITFGESYTGGNRKIEVPIGGLATQIIFNADNIADPVWDAPVKIGFDGDPAQVILTGPGYTNTAASLGGGSVGLAPFDLHDESCAPANGETVLLEDADPALEVKLRHYGPITLNANAPVTIERRTACTTDEFVLLSSTDFDYAVDPADGNSLLVSGALGADGFEIGYEYRLIATADLMCDQVDGNPAVSWDSPDYRVTVRPACPADLDRDCAVDVKDLLILLGAWGSNPGHPADLDCNTFVGVPDLLDLVGDWGLCPCGAGQPPPSLLAELTAACLDMVDWINFVDRMTNGTPAEQANYLCWMIHYLDHCSKCLCLHTGECPGADPFN